METPASGTSNLTSDPPYPLEERKHKIDYIIERTTGIPSVQSLEATLEEARDAEYLESVRDERNARFDQLDKLPSPDFERHFLKIRQEVQNDVDRLCKPADASVFTQWIEKDAWLPAEALSVWLGLDPGYGVHLIPWAERNRGLALAAVEVRERWDLITRAMWASELAEPLRPKIFADWAHGKRKLSGHFGAWLEGATTTASVVPAQKERDAELDQLRNEVERLRKDIADLNQPHYKLCVKLFGALCAGMFGHRVDKRNRSTAIVTEILEKFIFDIPGEKSVRKYIKDSIMELDRDDVAELAAIYEDKAKDLGKPELLDRNFPEPPQGFRTHRP